ncbi:cupredoxin domain-containing protein [Paenibacillus lautus]|uniref:cytochrome C oxidase subunit II n=1 Tax=Paenibacillus lautus TaxID=1401 RepID=UPI002DC01E15|nr:cytochrome C oxidase subunit II [Paenibacillus lautus]MEC0256778.1 cytochrome c oxidase subunit II [Paenibacillus lautus]
MKKWMLYVGFVFAMVAIITGCGSKEGQKAASPEANHADLGAGGVDKAITIHAKNFEFDQKEIKLKQGDIVSITLKTSQGNHAIHIEGYDKDIKENDTVTFTADQIGKFKYACSIMCGKGHSDMVGTLIVE